MILVGPSAVSGPEGIPETLVLAVQDFCHAEVGRNESGKLEVAFSVIPIHQGVVVKCKAVMEDTLADIIHFHRSDFPFFQVKSDDARGCRHSKFIQIHGYIFDDAATGGVPLVPDFDGYAVIP